MSNVKVVVTGNCDDRDRSRLSRYMQDALGWKPEIDFSIERPNKPDSGTASVETDDLITCVDCGSVFSFSAGEKKFFSSQGFQIPKRCKACRVKRKSMQTSDVGSPDRRNRRAESAKY